MKKSFFSIFFKKEDIPCPFSHIHFPDSASVRSGIKSSVNIYKSNTYHWNRTGTLTFSWLDILLTVPRDVPYQLTIELFWFKRTKITKLMYSGSFAMSRKSSPIICQFIAVFSY
jgi:hypothetical protein